MAIENIKEIMLYGSGKRCNYLYPLLDECGIYVNGIIDSNKERWHKFSNGHIIAEPDILKNFKETYICITVLDYESVYLIRDMLIRKYKINEAKIIPYNKLLFYLYENNLRIKKKIESLEFFENQERNIIFDCSNGLGLGGIQEWTKSICVELLEQGYDNIFIVSNNGSYAIPALLEKKVEYISIDRENRYSFESILNILQCFSVYLPCKAVSCRIGEFLYAALLLKKYYPDKIEIISVIHGGTLSNYEGYMQIQKGIDRFVGVSRDIVCEMMQRGVKKERIDHMTCPVKCEKVLKRTYTIDKDVPLRIGYAGRLEIRQKRIDLLIKLIEEFEKMCVKYELLIAGEGEGRDYLCRGILELQVEDRVKLLGRIERTSISGFWRECDICINIADYEGRSITIMEAMANGAVPVVTATSGTREDIVNGVNGFLVDIGDYKLMAKAIERLDINRDLLCSMGQKAHENIESKCQMSDHVLFWKQLLELK